MILSCTNIYRLEKWTIQDDTVHGDKNVYINISELEILTEELNAIRNRGKEVYSIIIIDCNFVFALSTLFLFCVLLSLPQMY